MKCIETVVVRSLKEAASFRKRHQSDENVKDKKDNHSPFKRKPKGMNIPFSDEPTLPLSCTSDVNLLADDNILEVVELHLLLFIFLDRKSNQKCLQL